MSSRVPESSVRPLRRNHLKLEMEKAVETAAAVETKPLVTLHHPAGDVAKLALLLGSNYQKDQPGKL